MLAVFKEQIAENFGRSVKISNFVQISRYCPTYLRLFTILSIKSLFFKNRLKLLLDRPSGALMAENFPPVG